MKYRIGEIAALIGLSAQSVRNLEELGLLHPDKGENAYRYYEPWDLIKLGACRHFRGLGFSLAESAEMLRSERVQDVMQSLKAQEAAIEQEIEQQCLRLRGVRAWRRECEANLELVGGSELCENVATQFLPYCRCDELLNEPERVAEVEAWMACIPYVYHAFVVPQAHLSDGADYLMGVGAAAEALTYLGLAGGRFSRPVPAKLCLHTAFYLEQQAPDLGAALSPALESIRTRGFCPGGDAFCRVNTVQLTSGGDLRSLVDCFIPVE